MSDRNGARSIGAHSLCLEPPDTLRIVMVGDLSAAEAAALFDTIHDLSNGLSHFFALTDVTGAGGISPGARSIVRERTPSTRLRGTAVFGASFHLRVIATLVAKAVTTVKRDFDAPITFFETEDEARAWIEKRRGELAALAGRSSG
jgi:SpoIIAA-like